MPPASPDDFKRPDGAGDGVKLDVQDARGAQRTGRNIWILGISMALAVVVVLGYWLTHASHMSSISHPQPRDESNRDISTYNMTGDGARQAPPGEPSTTTANAQ